MEDGGWRLKELFNFHPSSFILLPYTKRPKHALKHVFDIDPARKLIERMNRRAQMRRRDGRRQRIQHPSLPERLHFRPRRRQRRHMPSARDYWLIFGGLWVRLPHDRSNRIT